MYYFILLCKQLFILHQLCCRYFIEINILKKLREFCCFLVDKKIVYSVKVIQFIIDVTISEYLLFFSKNTCSFLEVMIFCRFSL